jgi:nitroreductase
MFEETLAEAWGKRFGSDPPEAGDPIAPFLRHRSVRKYSARAVDEATVSGLMACAQSAATSSNLQMWSVVSVQDPARREELAQLCGDQDQVREAAWFFAFLADHHRLRQAAARVGEESRGLDFAEFFIMALIDAALAAERMVCAAERLGLGICYIGALRNNVEGVQQALDLPPGTFGAFGLCLGWPEEPLRAEIKPRLPQASIWFREKYNQSVDVGDYDDRMRAFYESQRMKGDVTWSMRSGRRVDEHHLTGREALKPWLERQGFFRR